MGCLRISYSENESPLRVSRDEENVSENWQVWVGEKGEKKVKGLEDQASTGMTDFSNSNLALTLGGAAYGAMEGATSSQGYWLGKNGKYNSLEWGGNRYTGSRASALKDAKFFKAAGKATIFVSAGVGVYSTLEGIQADGGEFGYNAQSAAFSSAGSIAGGIAGAKGGAAVGAAIGVWFGGVGAVPGAVIGGVIGGIGGSLFGDYAGRSAVNYYHGRWP